LHPAPLTGAAASGLAHTLKETRCGPLRASPSRAHWFKPPVTVCAQRTVGCCRAGKPSQCEELPDEILRCAHICQYCASRLVSGPAMTAALQCIGERAALGELGSFAPAHLRAIPPRGAHSPRGRSPKQHLTRIPARDSQHCRLDAPKPAHGSDNVHVHADNSDLATSSDLSRRVPVNKITWKPSGPVPFWNSDAFQHHWGTVLSCLSSPFCSSLVKDFENSPSLGHRVLGAQIRKNGASWTAAGN
jgi:hypothetical protein